MGTLPANWFRENNPAAIVAMVSQITLASISLWDSRELIRTGFIDTPGQQTSIYGLYGMDSTGVWKANKDTSGRDLTGAQVASLISDYQVYLKNFATRSIKPSVASYVGTSAGATQGQRRIALIKYTTDGSGDAAAQALHTGPSGYYPVLRLKKLWSAGSDAATTLNLSSGGTLMGPPILTVTIVGNVVLDLGDLLYYVLTDGAAISLSIADGPVTSDVFIEIEYWSET